MSDHLPYLATLRRVPDSIVLSVASREIVPIDSDTCLCGWFVREQIARMAGKPAESVQSEEYGGVVDHCERVFGGEYREWNNIFLGIAGHEYPLIERAFVERVLECV